MFLAEGYLAAAEQHVEAYRVLERHAGERGVPVARPDAWPRWRETAELLADTGNAVLANDERYGAYLDAIAAGKPRARLTVEQLRNRLDENRTRAAKPEAPVTRREPKPGEHVGFAHLRRSMMIEKAASAAKGSALRQRMMDQMRIANLAESTQSAYIFEIDRLARHYGASPAGLDGEQLRGFILTLIDRGLSPSSTNSTLAAFRFLYVETLGCPERVAGLRNRKKPQALPRHICGVPDRWTLYGQSIVSGTQIAYWNLDWPTSTSLARRSTSP